MARKNGRKKINWGQGLSLAMFLVLGGGLGVWFAWYNDTRGLDTWPFGGSFLLFLPLLAGFIAALYGQIIIHEAGHLVFGLLSGYRFSSFRIGSLMWVKENGRLRFRRLSLAGTGGQCLMAPPPMVDGGFPHRLYNLGGSLMNVLAGLLFLALHLALRHVPVLSILLLITALIGFFFALMNGLPMRLGLVDNDGMNALSLGKHPEALRAFWLQLTMNARLAQGQRLRDMPEEWFKVPDDEAMTNSIVAALGVIAASRLMDERKFDEADGLMAHLLAIPSAVAGLHRGLLVSDRIFIELIGENRPQVVAGMLGKNQQKFMQAMKGFISILRTRYALALLMNKDEKKAGQWLARFEKAAKSYPYPSDVVAERELIALVQRKAQEKEGAMRPVPAPL